MVFKRKFSKKRRFPKRRSSRKGSSKGARVQQRAAMTWIRKKYTRVFTMDIREGGEVYERTISLIGAKNPNNINGTITLTDVNQSNQLSTDMTLYQFFRIRGVATKMIFPMPTETNASPVQWVQAYSANEVMLPQILPETLQPLATYQTGSCNQNKPISRYYNTATTYRRFGIQYCDTQQFLQFSGANNLYGNQLLATQGSSVNIKAYRQPVPVPDLANPGDFLPAPARTIGRLQVTYYVTYKGNKGTNSLVNPP